MTRTITILALSALAPLLASAVSAEARTGGPGATATAPNTAAGGRVMPPSGGAGAATPDERRTLTPREAQNDRIMRGICIGCSPR